MHEEAKVGYHDTRSTSLTYLVQSRDSDGLRIAGMERAGIVSHGRSEAALLGMTEIFRRNTATGSARLTEYS